MKKVIVFGGTGYCGSILTYRLLIQGYNVFCCDSFHRHCPKEFLNFLYSEFSNFEFKTASITDPSIKSILNEFEPDFVINLAGLVGEPIGCRLPFETRSVHVEGTINLIDSVPKDVVLFSASSSSVYGKIGKFCTEESPTNPVSIYAISKLEMEKILLEHPSSFSYRFATAYGLSPNMRTNLLINDLTNQATKNGSVTIFQADFMRAFIHVNDFADSIIWGCENFDKIKEKDYRIMNAGDPDANCTKRELAEFIKEKTKCIVYYGDGSYVDPDCRNYNTSYDKILGLGWKPKVTMESGITKMISWFKMQKESEVLNY